MRYYMKGVLGNIKNMRMDNSMMLTVEIAESWMKNSDSIDLNQFTQLTESAALMLSEAEKSTWLELNRPINLSYSVAELLCQYQKSWLQLNGLSDLSDAVARQLARHGGCGLGLCGLITLSRTVAGSLSQFDGALFLDGVSSLLDEVAEIISLHKGNLFLN